MMKRYYITIFMLFCLTTGGHAAGIFGMGINSGVSTGGGTLGKAARDINYQMRSVSGADVDEIDTPYVPVFSIEFLYSYQSLLIGLGWEYSSAVLMSPEGSIDGNTISLDYSRFTFPVSIGLAVPVSSRSRFYFAGGMNISYIVLQVNQSSPGAVTSLPDREMLFDAYVFGFHFKAGAEAVLSRNYSLVFEYTYYMGRETRVKDDDDAGEIAFGCSESEITAGIRYNLDLSMR